MNAQTKTIIPGEIFTGWCSNHPETSGNGKAHKIRGHQVRRLVLPNLQSRCLECHPELDPTKETEK